MPNVSIITINLNNKEGLDKTIRSVVGQTYPDFEYIVIDGGSDDGSLDVIKRYQNKITKWVSEKDTGIYNAMNKGLGYATGTYCLFLNSGDYLYSQNTLLEVFKTMPVEDIIYGNMLIQTSNGEKQQGEMPDEITLEHMIKDTLWHPVSFIKRNLFAKYGFYREDLKIVADYEFFLKNIVVNKVSTRHIPIYIAVFDLNGISSAVKNSELIRCERRKVQTQYIDEKIVDRIQLQIDKARKDSESIRFIDKITQWIKHKI